MPTIVLVIDKLASHRQMVLFAVRHPDRLILEAATGEQALSMIKDHSVDLLIVGCNVNESVSLTDLKLLCRSCRSSDMAVIVASHNQVAAETLYGLPVRSFRWIRKPLRLSEIQRNVEQALAE